MPVVEAHNRENLIVVHENDEFMLARLKCHIPEGEFTKEMHALYRQKKFGLGGWGGSGMEIADFKRKAEGFRKEYAYHKDLYDRFGKEQSCRTTVEWIEEYAPDFIRFFNWIDTL